MQILCHHCHRTIEYSGERPSFCGYCGQALLETKLGATAEYTPSDSGTATRPSVDKGPESETPRVVGGYRLVRRIGTGGMGTVYEAEAPGGRRVALKLVAPEYRTSQETLDRFRREGRLASMIAHPRCVFVLATDEDQGQPYIVMELMTGSTLMDLVRRQGPLSPQEAVTKIMDVIEGLTEAHECGVIHRDVKPSNCFLEPGGRVKVGDFGLAKSLLVDGNLTKTGTFMGTLFFASPEQVRGEPVDQQTDVYSVAATLYYVLTGKSPFQSSDAAATVAKIVSEPLKPMRSIRPELPAALDKVVQRGLERDRKRRFKDLEEFRAALLPFIPGRLSMGSMGLRFAAYLVDWLLFAPLVIFADADVLGGLGVDEGLVRSLRPVLTFGVSLVWIAYFALLEGVLGWSLGKRLLRLRVCSLKDNEPPGVWRAFVRVLVFYFLLVLPQDAVTLLAPHDSAWQLLHLAFLPVSAAAILLPMRARNGYRGTHELLSGTRVLQQSWPRLRRRLLSTTGWLLQFIRGRRFGQATPVPEGLPQQIGSFRIKGVLKWTDQECVLLGEDPSLERKIWIWLRPPEAPAIDARRQALARTTRLRWLVRGRIEGRQWDAFLAPAGCPLPTLVHSEGRLSWADARPILDQLAEELTHATQDGTLPDQLSLDQVWVQSHGRVQLVETPLESSTGDRLSALGQKGSTAPAVENRQPTADSERCLHLLRQTAILLLEGRKRSPAEADAAIHAPVPLHAGEMLQRLLGVDKAYPTVEAFQADLADTHDRPTEVTVSIRAGHLGVLGAVLLVPLIFMFLLPRFHAAGILDRLDQRIVAGEVLLRVLGDDALRGEFLASARDSFDADALSQRRPEVLAQAVRDTLLQDQRELQVRMQRLDWLDRAALESTEARTELFASGIQALRRNPGGKGFEVLVWRGTVMELDVDQPLSTTVPETRSLDAPQLVAALVHAGLLPGGSKIEAWNGGGLQFLSAALGSLVAAWVAWAFLTRGGFSFWLVGLTLLRGNGRKALRLQCAWRALLVWTPFVALLWLSGYVHERFAAAAWLAHGLSWLAIGLLLLYVLVALRYPDRALHDRLSGTYLVPR